ncbi:hypothetical protein EGW08_016170 [Elysia chlorotica]|uniref:Galectin n=1 Tax=Elysia chlorotica TaxID=188477 RepID=A0A3S1AZD9_ELYCH|nr:hypothetical protein EGW08_016170 [Elysia chlorotica]
MIGTMQLVFRILLLVNRVSLTWSICSMYSQTLHTFPGKVTTISCFEVNSTYLTTDHYAIQCFSRPECRVISKTCSSSGQCRFSFCHGVDRWDMTAQTQQQVFLMMTSLDLLKNLATPPSQIIEVPGGLAVGQVILAKITLTAGNTNFALRCQRGTALLLAFRMDSREIVRQAFLDGSWTPPEKDVPYFDFAAGDIIDLTLIFRQQELVVFFYHELFFTYTHKETNLSSINLLRAASDASEEFVLKSLLITL